MSLKSWAAAAALYLPILVGMGCAAQPSIPKSQVEVEICDNGTDDDSDGQVDCVDSDCLAACTEDCFDGIDNDQDGLVDCVDPNCSSRCDEICDDNTDNDGDGDVDCEDEDCLWRCDADTDGYISDELGGDDCDDGNPDVHPGATEVCNDDVDDDCDGLADRLDPGLDLSTCGGLGSELELSFAAGKHFGEAAADRAGTSVAGAGDVNNDGFDDVIIGAPAVATAGGDADGGAAYIVHGPAAGTFGLFDATARLYGTVGNDQAGVSVDGAGDFNNDGFDDVIVGAQYESTGAPSGGSAFIVHGPVSGDLDLENASAKLYGEGDTDRTATAVAGVGDWDRDGFDDVIIGADLEDAAASNAGAAYLVRGPVVGPLPLSLADAKLTGEAANNYAAKSIDGAGDVDGDGYDDAIIGSGANMAYLVRGTSLGTLALADSEALLAGEFIGDAAGTDVAGAGDVNDDGYADLVVGAPHNDATGEDSGSAYLVLGPVTGTFNLVDAEAKLVGEGIRDELGGAVSGGGDVDGDGFDDVFVGALHENQGGTNAGAAYVLKGPASGIVLASLANVKYVGESAEDFAGGAVAITGDLDNDGFDDMIIGADGEDHGGAEAGSAYIMYGGF